METNIKEFVIRVEEGYGANKIISVNDGAFTDNECFALLAYMLEHYSRKIGLEDEKNG